MLTKSSSSRGKHEQYSREGRFESAFLNQRFKTLILPSQNKHERSLRRNFPFQHVKNFYLQCRNNWILWPYRPISTDCIIFNGPIPGHARVNEKLFTWDQFHFESLCDLSISGPYILLVRNYTSNTPNISEYTSPYAERSIMVSCWFVNNKID